MDVVVGAVAVVAGGWGGEELAHSGGGGCAAGEDGGDRGGHVGDVGEMVDGVFSCERLRLGLYVWGRQGCV